MPLTKEERDFLDAYVYEATHEPFSGPATNDLRRRDIYYADLHGALTAYHRETTGRRTLPFGKHNPCPPPSPWPTRADAERRNQALLEEYTAHERTQPTGADADGNGAKHTSKTEL